MSEPRHMTSIDQSEYTNLNTSPRGRDESLNGSGIFSTYGTRNEYHVTRFDQSDYTIFPTCKFLFLGLSAGNDGNCQKLLVHSLVESQDRQNLGKGNLK